MLIAERVMGWKRGERYGNGNGEWQRPTDDPKRSGRLTWEQTPRYSTDIAAAWQVVEKWRAKGEGFQLDSLGFTGVEGETDAAWRCSFMDATDGGMEHYSAEAETAPLAICLAALAAVESVAPAPGGALRP